LLSDLHLILVGEGTDRARMNRLAGKLFPQRVLYTGVVKDYRDILARVEVVWVPSLAPRGFNVALEAMAAGKPVIASRLPGLMEIIKDNETGFLAPVGDKVAVARQTRGLLDAPTRCREMGEAGRRRALERFSVTTLAESYLRLYNSLAGSRLFQLPK
jgi:glycosyltransferase involved in cell wall biosynthesis